MSDDDAPSSALVDATHRLGGYAGGWQFDAEEIRDLLNAGESETAIQRLQECTQELRQTADKIESAIADADLGL